LELLVEIIKTIHAQAVSPEILVGLGAVRALEFKKLHR
jgi:hypothetical protein